MTAYIATAAHPASTPAICAHEKKKSYFDFFEEAFNYIAYKGYIRMTGEDEREWMDTMNNVHAGVKGGMKYNTGKLLLVMYKPLAVDDGDYAN